MSAGCLHSKVFYPREFSDNTMIHEYWLGSCPIEQFFHISYSQIFRRANVLSFYSCIFGKSSSKLNFKLCLV